MAKEKFTLEYDMRSTPVSMLWSYIVTANRLKEWFADDAKMDGKEVVLIWNGVEQGLSIVGLRTEKYIRYRWSEDTDKTYFELRIMTSELTGNSVLCVTDFAEPEELRLSTARMRASSSGAEKGLVI